MLRITDDYVVDIDTYNYTAKIDKHKTTVDKDGIEREVYEVLGYYGCMTNALKGIRKDMLKKKLDSDVKTLDDCISIIGKINDAFEDIISKVNDQLLQQSSEELLDE